MRRVWAVLAAVGVLVGCAGSDSADPTTIAPTTVETSAVLDGFTGELVITRQRDLLDRGLINVRTRNDSGQDLVITDR